MLIWPVLRYSLAAYDAVSSILSLLIPCAFSMSYLNVLADPSLDAKSVRPQGASDKHGFKNLAYLNDLFRYRSLVRVGSAAKNFQVSIKILFFPIYGCMKSRI